VKIVTLLSIIGNAQVVPQYLCLNLSRRTKARKGKIVDKEIYLAGGCFWGVEKYFSLIDGVKATSVGYANGLTDNPSYEDVCFRDSGHAETVQVVYEPAKISLRFLLTMFFEIIDPTTLNRQGNDRGTQYRSAIFYTAEEDLPVIKESLANLQLKHRDPLAIEVKPLDHYYLAEDYHQNYLAKNPQGYCHIGRQKFAAAARIKPEAS
jgi:methionine-S-sulfoxide reductase